MKVGDQVIVRSEQQCFKPLEGVIVEIDDLKWDKTHSDIGYPIRVQTENGVGFYRESELEVISRQ